MLYIYCDRPSKTVKAIKKELGIPKITISARPKNATVINWGCTSFKIPNVKVLNPPEAVLRASNKLEFFKLVDDLGIVPRFYTSLEEASTAMNREGVMIVCRTILNGSSGNGIILAKEKSELVKCKLYVEYVKKKTEWRIHVFNDTVIDVQRKARNKNIPDEQVNWYIRNHDNGFIYTRGDIETYSTKLRENLLDKATIAIKATGLNFGAVDLIATKDEEVYVLEINSAPGLEGTTLKNYIEAFKEYK